ncbi:hypothetical protein T439DRAFT_329422 [Meredithblackwellia eburnea MCA 4105]
MFNASTIATTATTTSSILNELPFYYSTRPQLIPQLRDKYLSVFAPFATYWIISLLFHTLDNLHWPSIEKYRIHPLEIDNPDKKNRVTVPEVLKAVFVQQGIQTLLGLWWIDEDHGAASSGTGVGHEQQVLVWARRVASLLRGVGVVGEGRAWLAKNETMVVTIAWYTYWYLIPVLQLFLAAFILDGWQYFWHRYFHENLFLYRKIHSWHHRLYVPYAFGALYNHPLEGFVLDTLGTAIAESVAQMSTRQATLFFVLSTWKTVDDHCGFNFPWDPVQRLFGNNSDYHDIHHQIGGLKKNYSQPYFIHFDIIFKTRMTREEYESRKEKRRRLDDKFSPPTSTPTSGNVSEVDEDEKVLHHGHGKANGSALLKENGNGHVGIGNGHANGNGTPVRRSTRVKEKVKGKGDSE